MAFALVAYCSFRESGSKGCVTMSSLHDSWLEQFAPVESYKGMPTTFDCSAALSGAHSAGQAGCDFVRSKPGGQPCGVASIVKSGQ